MKHLEKLRKVCLALPGAHETFTWGHPQFRVDNKIFCGCDESSACFKVGKQIQGVYLEDPRFFKTPYVGQHGWVSLRMEGRVDWREVRGLVEQSYRLIATGKKRSNSTKQLQPD